LFFLFISQGFSQQVSNEKKSNFGFYLSGLINKFQNNNNSFDQKYNAGFGLGLFFLKTLNKSFNLEFAVQTSQEYHKFEVNNYLFRLKEINLSFPVDVQYRLFGKSMFASGGIEYLNVLKYEVAEEIKLKRNNFNTSFGLTYRWKLRDFTISPQLKYNIGLNNSFENAKLENNITKKSGFSLGIKLM
jgi:hypothetical protein